MNRRSFVNGLLTMPSFLSVKSGDGSTDRHFYGLPSQGPQVPRLHDTLGVSIHGIEPSAMALEAVVNAGFHWVRNDLFWSAVETVRGEYDFARQDRYFSRLVELGMNPYVILDYGNPLYGNGAQPSQGSDVQNGFINFVRAATQRYAGIVTLWEIWNEPNNPVFWKPRPDPDAYARLCLEAVRVIRGVAPDAKIAGGATGGIDTSFLKRSAELGAFADVDFISVHPYRSGPPESAIEEMNALRATLAQITGRSLPVISGEWGYTTAKRRVSATLQAAFLVRMMLSNFAVGHSLAVWYDLEQDGSDETNDEHNYGILKHGSLEPLPAYTAAQVMNRIAGDATIVRRQVAEDGCWIIQLDRHDLPITAVWATTRPITRTLKLSGPTMAVDMRGTQLWYTAGRKSQPLNQNPEDGPIYIVGHAEIVA